MRVKANPERQDVNPPSPAGIPRALTRLPSMVLHGGSGDGAKNKATKTTVKHASNTPATTALAAGLREAQKEKQASAQKVAVSLDDLSDDDDEMCSALNAVHTPHRTHTPMYAGKIKEQALNKRQHALDYERYVKLVAQK